MPASRLEAALAASEDPTAKARALLPLHRIWSETAAIPGPVRPVVARSWQRQSLGPAVIRPLDAAGIRERRERAAGLSSLVPLLRERLLGLAADAGNELVISDDEGYVLWVDGPSQVRRRSDGIGFVGGARWRETDVGTNSLGAAMAERAPVQIFGPEHAREEQHAWVCTSAPLIDPAGAALGTVTLSGSYRTAHPHTLALVCAAVAEASGLLAARHDAELARLAGRVPAPAAPHVLVDPAGWVARTQGFGVAGRLRLPGGLGPGPLWVAGLGHVVAEAVDGGWLLRAAGARTELELLAYPAPRALIHHGDSSTVVPLSERHHQILALLAAHPAGLDVRGMLARLEGATTEVTVRAELSRLRRRLGGLIESRPYRLVVPVLVHG